MKAEILYIPDCPNLPFARAQVERILAEQGVACPVEEIEVANREAAERFRFAGSPTIRIEGEDVSVDGVGQIAFACRAYGAGGRLSGTPPDTLVRNAIRRALDRGRS